MNVLLLGSGGREHAIAWKLSQSSLLRKLHIAPGNGGMEALGVTADLDPMDFPAVERYVKRHEIGLLIVGAEAPLVAGIADYFEASNKTNVMVVGPKGRGHVEGKDFAKAFMQRHNIPTARYASFDDTQLADAIAALDDFKPPYVLKADGLAAGRGHHRVQGSRAYIGGDVEWQGLQGRWPKSGNRRIPGRQGVEHVRCDRRRELSPAAFS